MQAILRKQSGITQLLIKAEQLGYMVHANLLLRLSLCSVLQIAKRSHKGAAPTAEAAPFLSSQAKLWALIYIYYFPLPILQLQSKLNHNSHTSTVYLIILEIFVVISNICNRTVKPMDNKCR